MMIGPIFDEDKTLIGLVINQLLPGKYNYSNTDIIVERGPTERKHPWYGGLMMVNYTLSIRDKSTGEKQTLATDVDISEAERIICEHHGSPYYFGENFLKKLWYHPK